MGDTFGSLLPQFTMLVVVIMASTEIVGKGIKRLRNVPQRLISIVMGAAWSSLGMWFGWLQVTSEGWKGYLEVVVLSVAAVFIAGITHDFGKHLKPGELLKALRSAAEKPKG